MFRSLLAACFLLLALSVDTAAAHDRQQPAAVSGGGLIGPLDPWLRSLYKTITYNTAGNLSDLLLYGGILGGAVATAPSFLAANIGLTAVTYYVHELGWEAYGPERELEPTTLAVKTVSYRAVSLAKNLTLAAAFSGGAAAATGFAIAAAVSDTLIFVGNEFAWDALSPRRPPPIPPGGPGILIGLQR